MRVLPLLLVIGVALACSGGEREAEPSARGAAQAVAAPLALGRYSTDTMVGPDSIRRLHTLALSADSVAVFESAIVGGARTSRPGRYSATGPNLTVTLPAQGRQMQQIFRWRLIVGRLVPVDWDRTLYGPAGLTLHLR